MIDEYEVSVSYDGKRSAEKAGADARAVGIRSRTGYQVFNAIMLEGSWRGLDQHAMAR